MTKSKRVPVTERAVMQRINRKFRSEGGPLGREVKKTRGKAKDEIGDFYILDAQRGGVTTRFVNLEKLARELGVLADWEHLEGGN
jgi:hypothetical protein